MKKKKKKNKKNKKRKTKQKGGNKRQTKRKLRLTKQTNKIEIYFEKLNNRLPKRMKEIESIKRTTKRTIGH